MTDPSARRSRNGTVLVVEDDGRLRELLVQELGVAGYDVTGAGTVAEALYQCDDARFDLVVLDLGLPDGDGMEVAAELRERDEATMILMLTARADVDSRVEGLYAGAADYLSKPFALPELLARVHARMRERSGRPRPAFADLWLDPDTRRAVRGARSVPLRDREYALLALFVQNPGRLYAKEEIAARLYEDDEAPLSNTVEVFVHHLRRKLTALGLPEAIRTVRGRGYMLR